MNIDELKETPEWKAATKQKRHAFLASVVTEEQRAERQRLYAEQQAAKKAAKALKRSDNANLAELAQTIFKLSGRSLDDARGIGLYGAIAPKVQEIVGSTYSGSVKAFMKANQDKLILWCESNHGQTKTIASKTVKRKSKPKKANAAKAYQIKKISANQPSLVVTPMSGVNVASDAFLLTFEWRKVRMMALKKYGPTCQCCGATPATGAVMNVDHIKPRKLFPQLALDVDNLQILCHECNHGKGNWDMTDWRKKGKAITKE